MSHTIKLKTVPIRDIQAVVNAIAELNTSGTRCRLVANQAPRMYYDAAKGMAKNNDGLSQFQRDTGKATADYCIVLEDSTYDLGLVLNGDGTYETVADYHANYVRKELGWPTHEDSSPTGNIGKFLQMYAKHTAMNAATAAGHCVTGCTVDEQGNLQLTVASY